MYLSHHLLKLPDDRLQVIDKDTDAATLYWVLSKDLVPKDGPIYEFIRRLIRKNFKCSIRAFLEDQKFPDTETISAEVFLASLAEESRNRKMWAHPLIWLINNWTGGAKALCPLVWREKFVRNDLEAAIYILGKKEHKEREAAVKWVKEMFKLSAEDFYLLFVQTSLLHSFNYFSRQGNEALVERYRKDIQELIDESATFLNKAETELKNHIVELRRLNVQVGYNGNLSLLVDNCERVLRKWQILRSQQALSAPAHGKKKKK